MTESMITKFKASVEPHVESFDALIHFSRAIELFLVHETNNRDVLLAEGREQLCGHLRNITSGHVIGVARRQIVNRDRDLPVRWSSREAGQSHARPCRQDYPSLHFAHGKVSPI